MSGSALFAELAASMTPLEWIAFFFTVANVWLTVKENIWCWPTGFVSVVLYAIVFYKARLYSSAALQIVFFILTLYGWYEWLYGGKQQSELHVTATPRKWWPALAALCVALTFAIGRFMQSYGAAFVYWDAAIAAMSIVAQWMMAKKLLENWILWLIVNVLSIFIYARSHIYVTALLYTILLVLAFKGYVEWRRSLRNASA
jgi:nicotinamide mononucleotide transporter